MQGERIKFNKCQYKILNREYKIGPMISKGQYGCVYYAEKQGMPKAIKIIDMLRINNLVKNSLEKEFRIMKQCEGKFSVECERENKDNQNNIKFIVMELCSQHSLEDLIFRKGHLGYIQAKVYLKNILCGIINMHKLNFSHRDIKSSNVCIRNDRCILIDFGCAREFDGNGSGQMITNVGTIINKSPQILSGRPYTYKTDYWAVGILYYQILTGVTPFNLKNMKEHKEMLKEISKNINSIYDADYIKNRVLKQFDWDITYKFRANYKIREKTKKFLSRLITLDPQNRYNQNELKNCDYLKEQLENEDIWEISKCFLPLKNDNWDEIIPKIEQSQSLQKSKVNQQLEIQMQILEEKKSFEFEEITMLRDITSEDEINELFKKHNQMTIRDKNKIGILRKYDFQVKRIKLLIELKNQLKKIAPPLLCLRQFIVGVNYYCLEKMKNVKWGAAQNVTKQSKSLTSSKVRINLLYAYLCKQFAEDNKQYSCNLNFSSNAVKGLVKICQRVVKQQFRMSADYQIFWENYKQILQYQYEPSEKIYIWLPWNSFALFLKCIKLNAKFKESK